MPGLGQFRIETAAKASRFSHIRAQAMPPHCAKASHLELRTSEAIVAQTNQFHIKIRIVNIAGYSEKGTSLNI